MLHIADKREGSDIAGNHVYALLQDIDISERISQAPKQRISIYCIAESLDRKLLEKRLEARGPSWLVSKYPDVLYGQYTSLENPNPTGVSACINRQLQ